MGVTVHIPAPLRPLAAGQARIRIDGAAVTVADALGALWAVCPAVRDRVVTEQGDVRPHVNVFVGTESIRFTGGLATALPAEAEIWILPAVSGG